jgi:myo-inositol-1-phosphate synthase
MGKVLNGISDHMRDYHDDHTFIVAKNRERSSKEVVQILKGYENGYPL